MQDQKAVSQGDTELSSLELFSLTRLVDIKTREGGGDLTGGDLAGLTDLLCRLEDRLAVLRLERGEVREGTVWRVRGQITREELGQMMVPLLDMLQHGPVPTVKYMFSEDGATVGVRQPRGEMAGPERCWTHTRRTASANMVD